MLVVCRVAGKGPAAVELMDVGESLLGPGEEAWSRLAGC